MIAYKITGHPETIKLTKRIYVKSEYHNSYILCATPTSPTEFCWGMSDLKILEMLKDGKVIQVDLKDERWVQPHLLKTIRKQLSS